MTGRKWMIISQKYSGYSYNSTFFEFADMREACAQNLHASALTPARSTASLLRAFVKGHAGCASRSRQKRPQRLSRTQGGESTPFISDSFHSWLPRNQALK